MSREIEDSCKYIRDKWEEIKRDFIEASPGKYLALTTTHRTPREQFELYKQGRTMGTDGKWYVQDKAKIVTNVNGSELVGAHNYYPSRAIDVAVVDNQTGKYLWDEKWYYPLREIAKRYSLTWGGDWKSIKDFPHLEVPKYKEYQEV